MDDRTFDDPIIAEEWMELVESGSIRDSDIHPMLRAWIETHNPHQVLEIGAGQGLCSDNIDLKNRHYTGIDPSPYFIQRAQELYGDPSRTFLLGNAYALPFKKSTFDAVFSVMVFHLLENLEKATQELSRVLKANGSFLLVTANPDAFDQWKNLYPTPTVNGHRIEGSMKLGGRQYTKDILYLHSLETLKSCFQAADLEIQRTQTFRSTKKNNQQNFLILITGKKN